MILYPPPPSPHLVPSATKKTSRCPGQAVAGESKSNGQGTCNLPHAMPHLCECWQLVFASAPQAKMEAEQRQALEDAKLAEAGGLSLSPPKF